MFCDHNPGLGEYLARDLIRTSSAYLQVPSARLLRLYVGRTSSLEVGQKYPGPEVDPGIPCARRYTVPSLHRRLEETESAEDPKALALRSRGSKHPNILEYILRIVFGTQYPHVGVLGRSEP